MLQVFLYLFDILVSSSVVADSIELTYDDRVIMILLFGVL